jgi:non-ribosomal peptide synthetase component F
VALDELCRRTGVTPYMAMLAVFQVVLHRYTGCERVAVGTPIAGRRRRELEGLLGTLANIVVMATDLSGDPVFLELLARVREVTTGAYAHQDVPFEMLVDKLQVERNASSNPLFQVMFALHQEKLAAIELPGLRAMPVELGPAYSHFDLGLHFWRHEDGFAGFVSYNSDLFEPSTIRRLIGHFQVLLAEAVRAPERRISSLPLLTQEEQRWVAERSALSRCSPSHPVETRSLQLVPRTSLGLWPACVETPKSATGNWPHG